MAKRKITARKKQRPKKTPPRPKIIESIAPHMKLVVAGVIAVFAILLYAPSYDYGFVYDDDAVIKDNRFVQQGVAGLGDIWSTSYFKGYSPYMNVNAFRPVPLTMFALEKEFFGVSPTTNHIVQIILYGLTGFFLFLFLASLLRRYHFILPLMATIFFIAHPLHVEVVANVKSRDELMAFLNFAIAGWLLLKYIDTDKLWTLGGALCAYTIALFSKESAVTTLAIIPAMLYFFRNLEFKKLIGISFLFLVLALIFVAYRYNVIGSNYIETRYFDNSLLAVTGAERVASNIMVLGFYLFKTVFPHPLISDYSYSTLPNVSFGSYKVWLSLLAYGGLLFLMIKGILQKKVHGFAIFYYLVTVSLFTSVLFPGFSVYNDRFLYHPALGICLLVSWGIYQLFQFKKDSEQLTKAATFLRANPLPIGILIILMGLCVFKLETRLPDWADRYALFSVDSKLAPNNARMRKNQGGSYARLALMNQDTDPAKSAEYAQAAINELEAGLAIYPRMATGYIHLGNMYVILKNYTKSEEAFRNALGIDKNNQHAKVNLANVFYRTGRYKESVEVMESIPKSLLKPNDYYLMSLSYSKYGDEAKAAEYRRLSGR